MATEMSTVLIILIFYVMPLDTSDTCVCLKSCLGTLKQPVYMEESGETPPKLYVAEQRGVVSVYDPSWKNRRTFFDLSSKVAYEGDFMDERGLLGFALHPKFSVNRKIYTYSIRKHESKEYAFLTELQEISGKVDISLERVLLVINQPNGRRNGGQLLFGVDGYLYIMVGDGGVQQDDVDANATQAQDTSSLLGSILRIDVNKESIVGNIFQGYAIPPDNPSFNQNFSTWRPECFAIGFRNPWRCSIDKTEGQMFCGELGGNKEEEIDIIHKGGNYGWNVWEGNTCVSPTECQSQEYTAPIYSYMHPPHGAAVVGGYVYRGKKLKSLIGQYLFSDILSGEIFSLSNTDGNWTVNNVSLCDKNKCPCGARSKPGQFLLSFGQDNEGELYLLMTSALHGQTSDDVILKFVPPVEGTSDTCGAQGMKESLITSLIILPLTFLITLFAIRP